ncbi:MAG: hypothetical protein ACO23N_07700 [Opitutales bacterium]
MSQPDPTRHLDRLASQHFTTNLTHLAFHVAVDAVLASHPALNGSWSWARGPWQWAERSRVATFRISGFEQHGDIVLILRRTRRQADGSRIEVHHREGDRARLAALIAALGPDKIRPAVARRGPRDAIFANIAEVMQTFQEHGPGQIIVTESAVESALECAFDSHQEAIDEIRLLTAIRLAIDVNSYDEDPDKASRHRAAQYRRRWPKAPVVLHQGRKVHLEHQLHIPDGLGDRILKVHFAYLRETREHLIGWVEEELHCPF